jgi:hypothetical protein
MANKATYTRQNSVAGFRDFTLFTTGLNGMISRELQLFIWPTE